VFLLDGLSSSRIRLSVRLYLHLEVWVFDGIWDVGRAKLPSCGFGSAVEAGQGEESQ